MLNDLRDSLHNHARKVRARLADFRCDRRGNVAIITALAMIPMLAAVGCVIDYTFASMVRTKLQAAADSAALATVSNNSPIVASARTSGTVTNGNTYAANFFRADVTAMTNSANMAITPTANVTLSGNTMTAQVSYTAQIPTFFMGAVGRLMGNTTLTNISIAGASTATYKLPTYIDFYMMLDVSGSMGMPSTTAEQTRLQSVNPDNMGKYPTGCTFACHFTMQNGCDQTFQGPIPAVGAATNPSPGGYCQGYFISRVGTTPVNITTGNNTTNGNKVNWSNTPVSSCPTDGTTSCIQLRLDAVGYAVAQLLAHAQSTETNTNTPNEFRVGLYPFIQNLCYSSANNSNSCSVGLTSSLNGATINNFAVQLASLLDTGTNATLGSGGTHFENALATMNSSVITSVGTGSSTSPLPYLFLVTDGSQDYQIYPWSSQNWHSTTAVPYANSATVLPPNSVQSVDPCGTIKGRGIKIAILYIPYVTIQNPLASFANNEDGYANANIANIPASLQTCASPGFFYTASKPADIQAALLAMFDQAVSTAHLSN